MINRERPIPPPQKRKGMTPQAIAHLCKIFPEQPVLVTDNMSLVQRNAGKQDVINYIKRTFEHG